MSKNWEIFSTTEEYIAQVAHDARAPMSALKAALKNTKQNTNTEEANELSDQAMQRLENILSDLNQHSTLNPFTQIGQRKPNVAELIAKIVSEKKSLLNFDYQREVRMTQQIDPICHTISTVGPASYFERCLSNILDNAIEATSKDKQLAVQVKAKFEDGMVCVSVLDAGVGIPEQIIHLLGRTPITYNKEGGTGRGLYFVYRFLQSFDGELEIRPIVKGIKKGGTQVTFRIPVLH